MKFPWPFRHKDGLTRRQRADYFAIYEEISGKVWQEIEKLAEGRRQQFAYYFDKATVPMVRKGTPGIEEREARSGETPSNYRYTRHKSVKFFQEAMDRQVGKADYSYTGRLVDDENGEKVFRERFVFNRGSAIRLMKIKEHVELLNRGVGRLAEKLAKIQLTGSEEQRIGEVVMREAKNLRESGLADIEKAELNAVSTIVSAVNGVLAERSKKGIPHR